jgi:hypothetical protein
VPAQRSLRQTDNSTTARKGRYIHICSALAGREIRTSFSAGNAPLACGYELKIGGANIQPFQGYQK